MAAAEEKLTEIFSLSQDPNLSETGGGHGQKGVDFQRYWAILRIFELKQSGTSDFLLLFESLQDVAEFDSEAAPSRVDIYQIKKKRRRRVVIQRFDRNAQAGWTQEEGSANFV